MEEGDINKKKEKQLLAGWWCLVPSFTKDRREPTSGHLNLRASGAHRLDYTAYLFRHFCANNNARIRSFAHGVVKDWCSQQGVVRMFI